MSTIAGRDVLKWELDFTVDGMVTMEIDLEISHIENASYSISYGVATQTRD